MPQSVTRLSIKLRRRDLFRNVGWAIIHMSLCVRAHMWSCNDVIDSKIIFIKKHFLVWKKRRCWVNNVVMREGESRRKSDKRDKDKLGDGESNNREQELRESESTTDTLPFPRQFSPTIIQGNICFIIGPISIYRAYPPSVCKDGLVPRKPQQKKRGRVW